MVLHRAKERALIAKVMLDLIFTVHRGRLVSKPKSLTGEPELVLMAAVVLLGHVTGKRRTAAEVGRALGIPRITARRKLAELMRRGIVKREGTLYSAIDGSNNKFRYVDESLAIIRRAAESSK
jgi:response regulator of citrate/malate metabolism